MAEAKVDQLVASWADPRAALRAAPWEISWAERTAAVLVVPMAELRVSWKVDLKAAH